MTGLTAKSGEIRLRWLAKLVTVCKLKRYELLMKIENIQWWREGNQSKKEGVKSIL